jgi:hypothetical protein
LAQKDAAILILYALHAGLATKYTLVVAWARGSSVPVVTATVVAILLLLSIP